MSCIEVMRKLTDYLQGNLASNEAATVHHHVTRCPQCRIVLHSASETLRTYFPVEEEIPAVESHAA